MGINSGKALFAGASLKTRLEIITKQFDQAKKRMSQSKNQELEEKDVLPTMKKMQYYKIPFEKHARKPLDVYAKQYETTFEKLVKTVDSKHLLPIVANISRSTARTLITLQDLGAFRNEKYEFDFEIAQIFANIVMTFYVWGGHHSFTEVAEIYNRLLDYIVIQDPRQLPKNLISHHPSQKPYMEDDNVPEKLLPYYHIGNYSLILHSSF